MNEEMKNEAMNEHQRLRDFVLREWEKGNVVFSAHGELRTCKMEDFARQPLDGMLYDLNRDRATILAMQDDSKWVNDFCLTKVLSFYYERCKTLEEELNVLSLIITKKK